MNKEQELKNFVKNLPYLRSGGYFRCSICNSVSSENISTDIGDYKPNTSFTEDPKDHNHFICITCKEVIDDQLMDYEVMDEWNS